jgi:predicted ATPase/DNA-binding SARP family transcriptional activator
MASICLQLLGGLRLNGASGEQTQEAMARHHVRAVLALAGASAQGVERDALADALWPGSSAEAARNRLYHTVHLARRALSDAAWEDDWIAMRQGRVVLDERVACDVQQLERSLGAEGQPLEPQQVLALCQADWMPELQVGVLGESVRGRVRAQQVQALQQAVHQVAAQGDSPLLRALLQALQRIEPTDEAAGRALMQLDLQAGRLHAVLRTFEQISRALGTRLGLRPGDATCALAAQASQQLQSAPDTQQHSAKWALVGREPLVRDLVGQVTAQPGVWNLSGLGGIGKTSVAKEVASRVAPLMEDGVIVISLGDLQAYGGVAAACAHSMALSPTPGQAEMQLLVHAMRVRKMLLVLDDVDTADDLPALLDAVPRDQLKARVLLLTRSRIDAPDVQPVEIVALSSPSESDAVSHGARTASFALFQMRCPVTGPEQDSPAWQADVVALLRRLEGLPLAIELAAARTASLTPREILAEIERGAMLTGDGPVDLQGRHRSLRASLDWSVGLLSEPARGVYRALSVFPGAFARAAARPLMTVVGVQDNEVDAALDELLAAGLVKRVEDDIDSQRLRLLHLPRAHARAQAANQGQWQALQAARLAQVCQFLEDNALEYESPLFTARQQRVMQIEDDAVALLGFAQEHDPQRFVHMLAVLCESWNLRRSASLLLSWLGPGVQCARHLDLPYDELALRFFEMSARQRRDGYQASIAVFEAMTPLLEDPRLTTNAECKVFKLRAVLRQANNLEMTGRMRDAEQLCKTTCAKLSIGPDEPGYWLSRMMTYGYQRDARNFLPYVDLLRSRFEGSPIWVELLHCVLYCFVTASDCAARCELAHEMLRSSRALNNVGSVSNAMWWLANLQLAMNDPSGALETWEALARFSRHEHHAAQKFLTQAVTAISEIHWRMGDLDAAERCLNELAGDASQQQQSGSHLAMRLNLGRSAILALRGHNEEANRLLAGLSLEAFDSAADNVLIHWGETIALMAKSAGDVERARQVARLFRLLDASEDLLGFIHQSRDQHFGSTGPTCQPETDQVDQARIQLRAAIREFHAQLHAAATA